MSNRRQHRLLTPEGLALNLELGSASARAVAFGLDFGIMLVSTMLIVGLLFVVLPVAGNTTRALFFLVSFVLWNGYFGWFVLRWGGSTPGKRVMGLRVVSGNGGPLTTGAVMARNLLRDLEFYLPLQLLFAPQLLYGQGPGWAQLLASSWAFLFLFFPLLNRERARVGDLVAGTRVVVSPDVHLMPDAAEASESQEETFVFSEAQLDMYGIHELQVLEDIIHKDLGKADRFELLQSVCRKIARKIAWAEPIGQDQVMPFLQAFYRAQRRRLEHRLLFGERRQHKRIGRLKG